MIQMYNILLHPLADRFLKRLDKQISKQIKRKILELKKFPEQRGKHLRYTQFWSLRVGDYRVIYEIKENGQKIIVLFIGHRDGVYDDFSKLF